MYGPGESLGATSEYGQHTKRPRADRVHNVMAVKLPSGFTVRRRCAGVCVTVCVYMCMGRGGGYER